MMSPDGNTRELTLSGGRCVKKCHTKRQPSCRARGQKYYNRLFLYIIISEYHLSKRQFICRHEVCLNHHETQRKRENDEPDLN
jgi:hypothetical protein